LSELLESSLPSSAMAEMDMEQLLEIRRAASSRDIAVIKYLEEECGWAPDRTISSLGGATDARVGNGRVAKARGSV
jgi:hypothetical protein